MNRAAHRLVVDEQQTITTTTVREPTKVTAVVEVVATAFTSADAPDVASLAITVVIEAVAGCHSLFAWAALPHSVNIVAVVSTAKAYAEVHQVSTKVPYDVAS